MKYSLSYANAGFYNECVELLGTFEFGDQSKIKGVYRLDCAGGADTNSIVIDVLGVPPFKYRITEKDGDTSFSIDNGDKNIFENLMPGTYNFQVEDNCGNLCNGKYAIGSVSKLVTAYQPKDLIICKKYHDVSATFNLSQQTPTILKYQDSNVYKVLYYLTSEDADNGINSINNPYFFVNKSSPQTIYARVIRTELGLCHDLTSFQIFVGETPQLAPVSDMILCLGETKTLTVEPGYNLYEWSTGETNSNINITKGGIYKVNVKNIYGDSACEASNNITVVESSIANIDKIIVNDWTENTNSIQVLVSGKGNYEYSLDDQNFQNENIFTDLKPGVYIVYVRDKKGCGTISEEVAVLNYLRFFTPNGDGFNDRWQIQVSVFEPALKVFIYDRYGKLITGMDSQNLGWDGTLNGELLPSTDYWFMAERANGKVYRGHFALKR